MKEIEVKLRRGLQQNGITGKTQEEIVQAISSFALYGFPESHAASFALIAYASAYLKCNYLAAFTAAILNNQPMGFYQPFTLIKDAQRHGLKVRAIDITRSDWLCTIEDDGETGRMGDGEMGRSGDSRPSISASHRPPVSHSPTLPVAPSHRLSLRLGLKYVKGLSEQSGQAIVRERSLRPFTGIDDLRQRVPELRKDELRKLAAVGALNFIQSLADPSARATKAKAKSKAVPAQTVNRRDALWQVERVTRSAGVLYEGLFAQDGNTPLLPMTLPERVDADFRGTGLTIGKHPVSYHRSKLDQLGALRAIDIGKLKNGSFVRVAGWVIVRQRPGTAKGFMFLTLEDETGVSNIIVTPQLFDQYRMALVDHPFLLIEGALQNQDNVVSVKARRVLPLSFKVGAATSRDFH
jgi:error-prone DNA polymerase